MLYENGNNRFHSRNTITCYVKLQTFHSVIRGVSKNFSVLQRVGAVRGISECCNHVRSYTIGIVTVLRTVVVRGSLQFFNALK